MPQTGTVSPGGAEKATQVNQSSCPPYDGGISAALVGSTLEGTWRSLALANNPLLAFKSQSTQSKKWVTCVITRMIPAREEEEEHWLEVLDIFRQEP